MLWAELAYLFGEAHREPSDIATIRGCYEFAWWCVSKSQSNDTASTTLIAFYEDLPTDKFVRRRVPEFLVRTQFNDIASAFAYHLTPAQLDEFRAEFYKGRKRYEK